uniref:Reverse transcriptase zinc-binding domain-containing protein n=1 Tax=Arundo donax TaxID=35708 RepID=A0A0A8Y9Z1_ARUDO
MCNLGTEETNFHLFFGCPFSMRCWEYIGIGISWNPELQFFDMLIQGRTDFQQNFFMEIFIVAAW